MTFPAWCDDESYWWYGEKEQRVNLAMSVNRERTGNGELSRVRPSQPLGSVMTGRQKVGKEEKRVQRGEEWML